MRLTIFHLTDIHFSHGYNSILKKQDSLIKSIVAEGRRSNHILFCVTGDIANYGYQNEYADFALPFFDTIRSSIIKELPDVLCEFLFIPGNHDCDFNNEDSMLVRDELITAIAKKPSLANNSGFIENVLTQDSFNEFKALFHEEWKRCELVSTNALFDKVLLELGGKK